jgi:hypothetical protein
MGVVYAAHDDAMGRPVAVKVLMGDLESDPDTRARFYREAQAAAGLLHPNIITIYDAGEDQGRSYIAMQLLEGWPLAAYLKQPEAAPLERKLDLMVQMCEGLAAAHARGIVHRDLKPGNLFVQSDGLLKILDFGVARLADSSMTATGMMLGTPDYMSPEQARGTQVDARSDIFSAGAVFYYMLAGRKPFPGPDLPAVLRQLQSEDPPPLREADAPPELARLVMQAMAKDPIDRPPRVQELLAGIVRFRRHYQAGTRKLAAEAGARFNALAVLDEDLRRAAAVLDIPGGASSGVLAAIRERFPAVAERGGAALEAAPFDRARAAQVAAELEAEQQQLAAEAARRTHCAARLEEGERALSGGDARAALQCFEHVTREYPDSRRAAALVEESAHLAREQEAHERRMRELLAAARTALDARDWAATTEACEQALALAPDSPAAASMLLEAQQGIAREARRRALLVQQGLDRATVAIEEGRFDDAAAALDEVQALDPQSGALRDLRAELADARAAAAEAERLARQSLDEIRRARAAFRRGRYDDAIVQLRAFADAHPSAAQARAELDRLGALRDRVALAARERQQQAARLLGEAAARAERGEWDEAIALAAGAAAADPSDSGTSAALGDLLDRGLAARIERERARAREERSRTAEPLLAAARAAHASGYVALALEAAHGALRLAPARADIAELVEQLQDAIAADDEAPFDLPDDPFPGGRRVDPRPATAAAPDAAAPERPDGGVFSHVNQWAADLLRRRLPNR